MMMCCHPECLGLTACLHPMRWPGALQIAARCPVCEGRGYVANGFYESFAGASWITSSWHSEPCKSCNGSGYVLIWS